MSYISSVGLEIHIALKTNRKAFAPELVNDSSWVSLGFPGTLPVLNVEAIEQTVKLSSALNCQVNYDNVLFDRKNYFYYDLPRGYQITQFFHPIGRNGFIVLSSGKKIRIKQIHLEEDSAQQNKQGHEIMLSFGRLGRAIAEMVTEPDFNSYEEIEEFLKIFRRVCTFTEVSDVSYEEGEMRIDLNFSIRKNESDPLGNKSEVKNLNSVFALKKSIEHLTKVMIENLEAGKPNVSYTYGWIDKLKICEVMRVKNSTSDYFYIPESNIPKFSLSEERYKELLKESQIDFVALENSLKEGGIDDAGVAFLLDNCHVFRYVEKLNSSIGDWSVSYKWIVNVVSGLVSDLKNIPFDEVQKVILDVEKTKKINARIAKDILKEIIQNGSSYKAAIKKLKVSPVSDQEVIKKWVIEAFEQYKDQLPTLLNNPSKLERLIIGECMKKSKGQANPQETKKWFDTLLPNYSSQEIN